MLVGSATTPVRLRSYTNSLNCAQTLKAKSLHRAQTQYLSAGRYRSGWTPAQLPHTKIIAGPAATGLTAPMLIGSMSCREPAAGLAASWPWRKPRMTQTAQFNHGNRCSPRPGRAPRTPAAAAPPTTPSCLRRWPWRARVEELEEEEGESLLKANAVNEEEEEEG